MTGRPDRNRALIVNGERRGAVTPPYKKANRLLITLKDPRYIAFETIHTLLWRSIP
jgi:hypothetical protein